MHLFDFVEAEYFCRPLGAHQPGVGQSLVNFHRNFTRTQLIEGTQNFEIHRVSLLNAIERWILFGVADYRRALDMFVPSNAPWAHVTLYYSSFFAANAVLGMFGAWLNHEMLVDVDQGIATRQILRITRKLKSPNKEQGSHRVFWDFFYEAHSTLSPLMPPDLQARTAPVSGNKFWQIKARNEVNYDMFGAFSGAEFFRSSFDPRDLRSLPGPLGQQLDVTEAMLKLALYFAKDLKISSYAFEGLGAGSRSKVFRDLVTKPTPALVHQSILRELILH